MILPFSHQHNGQPTYFAEKINKCIVETRKDFGQAIANYIAYDLIRIEHEMLQPTSFFNEIKSKKHTFREDEKDRWRKGRLIHPYYFNRTKQAFQCAPIMKCTGIQHVSIIYFKGSPLVMIHNENDSYTVDDSLVDQMAINDGFNSVDDFFKWFNKDFHGKIIHWTDIRY